MIPRESNRRTHTSDLKQIVSNDFKDFTYTQEVDTDCVEHYDKVWNTKSDSIVEVCVYVCTVHGDYNDLRGRWAFRFECSENTQRMPKSFSMKLMAIYEMVLLLNTSHSEKEEDADSFVAVCQ